MTAYNRAQMVTIGAFLVAWGLILLYGKSIPAASALGIGWMIAWCGLHYLPKL